MIQVVKPNTNVKVLAGQCHKLARTVFGAPPREPSAWEGWKNAIGRHIKTSHPRNVSVPVWFSHYGTYGNPPRYKNWGHVVVYVPGRGYLSSPGSGYGNKWFKTIPEVERYFNCRLAGWSEGINGVRVVEKNPIDPIPEKPIQWSKNMATVYHKNGSDPRVWALAGDGQGEAGWIETTDIGLASAWRGAHHGNYEGYQPAIDLSSRSWDSFKSRYLSGGTAGSPGLSVAEIAKAVNDETAKRMVS